MGRTFISPSCCSWLALISLLLAGCAGGSGGGSSATPPPERITFSGAGSIGIFDPAVAQGPGSDRLWMSYSSVELTGYWPDSPPFQVSIRLAYSDDNGASWQDDGIELAAATESMVGFLPSINSSLDIPANSNGVWQSETSSLIYDPAAPAGEEWKLIWHQYLKAGAASYFVDYTWLAMKMAATPELLKDAVPIKLFAGYGLQAESNYDAANADAPIVGAPAIHLDSDLGEAELSNCIFAEPGLLATSTALYASMNCQALGSNIVGYVVLFKCASPCTVTDSSSWQYLGRLLTPADADAIGYGYYNAPQLVAKGGEYYLIATPVNVTNATTGEGVYSGCRVYRFSNLDSGELQRSGGVPVEVERVDGVSGTHNGACTDHAALANGILHSQFDDRDPPALFRIFQTFVDYP